MFSILLSLQPALSTIPRLIHYYLCHLMSNYKRNIFCWEWWIRKCVVLFSFVVAATYNCSVMGENGGGAAGGRHHHTFHHQLSPKQRSRGYNIFIFLCLGSPVINGRHCESVCNNFCEKLRASQVSLNMGRRCVPATDLITDLKQQYFHPGADILFRYVY